MLQATALPMEATHAPTPARLDRRSNPAQERRPLDRGNTHTGAACHPRFPSSAKAPLTRTECDALLDALEEIIRHLTHVVSILTSARDTADAAGRATGQTFLSESDIEASAVHLRSRLIEPGRRAHHDLPDQLECLGRVLRGIGQEDDRSGCLAMRNLLVHTVGTSSAELRYRLLSCVEPKPTTVTVLVLAIQKAEKAIGELRSAGGRLQRDLGEVLVTHEVKTLWLPALRRLCTDAS